MPTTLRMLLDDSALQLTMIAGAAADDAVLERPVAWVHSSDLADPTPWLEAGQVLLTDGVQFSAAAEAGFADAYVARLRARGVLALGFATEIVHAGIPSALLQACDRQGLPLFEVGAKTPFIGIIRRVADVIADERQARLQWTLDAQRAVARAALRTDGLGAILAELSHRLDTWVVLFDSVGEVVTVPQLDSAPADALPELAANATRLLARGSRAGLRLVEVSGGATMQTLGHTGSLRGVLAVGTALPLDPAENDLVSSVIALASIALEQQRTLDLARRHLRSGVLELLVAGVVEVADRTAQPLWGRLPDEPVRVTLVDADGQALLDELELLSTAEAGSVFFAERGRSVVMVTAADQGTIVHPVLARWGLRAGVSTPAGWRELERALREARRALDSATATASVVDFDDLAQHGLHGLLAASGGRAIAERLLKPLDGLPPAESTRFEASLHAWYRHNCVWESAARELGVHRHTLRSRVDAAAELLGLDLDDFAARSELFNALQLRREAIG
ncbi:PucR family transcriptional regulator [Subtercola sp. YIM 133946]|uniref:PucR family transcriptional regulator n=1 Tax=Subtercola sp. YIM 133946 TaxID=3118909 RepID=UPI002F924474